MKLEITAFENFEAKHDRAFGGNDEKLCGSKSCHFKNIAFFQKHDTETQRSLFLYKRVFVYRP